MEELVKDAGVAGTVNTPATEDLFKVDKDSAPLSNEERERFHSTVAKLLYPAERVRMDLQLAVGFLTTRVQKPTEQDLKKLERVLRYGNGTTELRLRVQSNEALCVLAYIDATFGVHEDMKSHSATRISLGSGVIYAQSKKQKLYSRSSTEAEIIAASDGLTILIWFRNLLLAQGYILPPATLFQDNQSAIAL